MESIGSLLRGQRETKGLLLREVAAALNMDTALLSKIERDDRLPSKEQVLAFAKYYKVKPDDLLIEWLSDKLTSEAMNEDFGLKAIQVAEEKVKSQLRKK